MAIIKIDGEIIEAKRRWSIMPGALYSRIVWKVEAGTEQRLTSVFAADPLVERIVEGSRGQFVVDKGLNGRQLCAHIGPDGNHVFEWTNAMRIVGIVISVVSLAKVVYDEVAGDGASLLILFAAVCGAIVIGIDVAAKASARKTYEKMVASEAGGGATPATPTTDPRP